MSGRQEVATSSRVFSTNRPFGWVPQVLERLGLRIEDVDLFSDTPPLPVREAFAAFPRDGTSLAP
jgi:hypothetical protein